MYYIVYILAVLLTVVILFQAHRAFLSGDTMGFYSRVIFMAFLLVPHIVIYTSEEFYSFYGTFQQGESVKALVLTGISAVVLFFVPLIIPPNFLSSWVSFCYIIRGRTVRFLSVISPAALLFAVILFCTGFWYLLKGGDSVGVSFVQAILTGDLDRFRVEYEIIRFGVEKSAVLLQNVRGTGSIIYLIKILSLTCLALVTVRLQKRFRLSAVILFLFAFSSSAFIFTASGARADLLTFLAGVSVGVISGIRRRVAKIWVSLFLVMGMFLAYTTFTYFTPKSGDDSLEFRDAGTFYNFIKRSFGNAVNDVFMIQLSDARVISPPSLGSNEPIDLQLNRVLSNSDTDWYESPTMVGWSYAYGGIFGVIANAYVLVLVMRLARLSNAGVPKEAIFFAGLIDFIIAFRFCFLGISYLHVYMAALMIKQCFIACYESVVREFPGRSHEMIGVMQMLGRKDATEH
jgi:hypothetical protein